MAKGKMKEIKAQTANGQVVITSVRCPQDRMFRVFNHITGHYVYIIHPMYNQYIPWDRQWIWVESRIRRILRHPRRPPFIYNTVGNMRGGAGESE